MSDRDPGGAAPPRNRIVIKAVRPHSVRPEPREVQDRARLAGEVRNTLETVRKTAENWRTGMAGLVGLVTATLLFKGRASIIDYVVWVRYALGVLVLLSLVLAVMSLWLFLRAAYGRLEPVSAQSILDAGGVDVYHVEVAAAALQDLRVARRVGLAGAGLLAAALLMSWYGAAERPRDNYVRIVVTSPAAPNVELPLCGRLDALGANTIVLRVAGEPDPRRISLDRLVSLNIIASC